VQIDEFHSAGSRKDNLHSIRRDARINRNGQRDRWPESAPARQTASSRAEFENLDAVDGRIRGDIEPMRNDGIDVDREWHDRSGSRKGKFPRCHPAYVEDLESVRGRQDAAAVLRHEDIDPEREQ